MAVELAGEPVRIEHGLGGHPGCHRVTNSVQSGDAGSTQGTDVRTGTPESLGTWLQTEQAKWAKVVKDSGVKFD